MWGQIQMETRVVVPIDAMLAEAGAEKEVLDMLLAWVVLAPLGLQAATGVTEWFLISLALTQDTLPVGVGAAQTTDFARDMGGA